MVHTVHCVCVCKSMLCLCWVYVDSNWKWISQRKRGGSEREREWEYQFTYMSWYVTRNALYRTHMVCMCNTRSVRMTQITFNPMRKLFSLHFNRTINTATATTNKLWFGYGHRTWYTAEYTTFHRVVTCSWLCTFFSFTSIHCSAMVLLLESTSLIKWWRIRYIQTPVVHYSFWNLTNWFGVTRFSWRAKIYIGNQFAKLNCE